MEEYEQAVFISYAWGGESEEIVDQIDQALQQRGVKILRDKRDLGYKGSISAFMERLGQGNCVIVVISDKYLRSPNCMFELAEIAEGKQFHDRIFPIVLSNAEIYDPVKRLEYVKYWEGKLAELDQAMRGVGQANLQGIREDIDQYSRIRDKVSGLTSILKDMNTLTPDLHRDSDFSEIYAGIERRMIEVAGQLKHETGESPYMGLRYFDTSDAALFYGREALTDALLARVQKESFLAIVGASGSGKSSVARAGLVPAWRAATMGTIHVITPTAHPLESLAASLTRESESVTATTTLMDDLQKDPRSLRLYVRKMLSGLGESKVLLVVDQFEESFTLCKDPTESKAFIENLLLLVDDHAEQVVARVVITLRADFYQHCFEYEGLRSTLEKHQANIGAMTTDELREAIVKPAEMNGWDFQPGLVDLILQDVGTEPGALPLLSHALLETWKRRQGRTLTLQGYHESGGVKKAITQTAESVYDQFSPAEQTVARNIFLRLTELGEGVQDTRRRATLDELSQAENHEAVEKVLKTLTDARLVTAEQDSAEVAHEALIREWGTLRTWLDEDRENLRLHRHLTESAQGWDRNLRDAGDLYRGARLAQALEWVKAHDTDMSQLEAEYLNASQAEQRREQRGMRTRKVISIGAVAFVIENIVVVGVVLFLLIRTGYLTTPGNTVQHTVAQEETTLDIARCYGASLKAIMDANPQIDVRDTALDPGTVVAVPDPGSVGPVYGPPCGPIFYTVVAGDSWQSIAAKYNADVLILLDSNTVPVTLSPGMKIKVPQNSAGGPPITPSVPLPVTQAPPSPTGTLLTLTVTPTPNFYSAPGQQITFTYIIMNSGTANLGPAQFIVNDNRFPSPINCGPNTTSLAPNQSVSCTAVYVTTQTDITMDQIVSNATASGAGVATSQPAVTTIRYSP
jgi:LysM repeat protein